MIYEAVICKWKDARVSTSEWKRGPVDLLERSHGKSGVKWLLFVTTTGGKMSLFTQMLLVFAKYWSLKHNSQTLLPKLHKSTSSGQGFHVTLDKTQACMDAHCEGGLNPGQPVAAHFPFSVHRLPCPPRKSTQWLHKSFTFLLYGAGVAILHVSDTLLHHLCSKLIL